MSSHVSLVRTLLPLLEGLTGDVRVSVLALGSREALFYPAVIRTEIPALTYLHLMSRLAGIGYDTDRLASESRGRLLVARPAGYDGARVVVPELLREPTLRRLRKNREPMSLSVSALAGRSRLLGGGVAYRAVVDDGRILAYPASGASTGWTDVVRNALCGEIALVEERDGGYPHGKYMSISALPVGA